ncbi:hypothetical protein [uncultured Treponema sp.]|uniref:hypothetical protein n=1 Tax=uncultured Treponema sp. TaxID=162155 RepID=UPI002585405B|nr:hypothetical protein [uncultured Treponema sp.]
MGDDLELQKNVIGKACHGDCMSYKDASFCAFVSQVSLEDIPIEDSYGTIFSQYEEVIVQALVSSFGLDFLIQDQHGGDVDTIHNVREIGKDPEMRYKNQQNSKDYANRGDYNTGEYHGDYRNGERTNFAKAKHNKKNEYFENGNKDFKDEYTGKTNLGFLGKSKNAPSDKNAELDHIVEAKAIHDDPGRVLAELDGKQLADSPENFAWTNKSLNASMGSWANQQMQQWEKQCKEAKKTGQPMPPKPDVDMEAYITAHPELDETTKANMREHFKKAKKAYDAKLNRAYYTSKKFWKDTGTAAAKLGLSMGLRQALGLVFTEIWFTVKDAIIQSEKDGKALFDAIAKAVKQGLNNAKKKFKEIWEKFIEGAVAGVLSSLVTTLANIFFTTAKNVIKIIRESFASLSQASKILFINPDSYPLGDRFVAAAKVLATGASVIAGSMVKELFKTTPIAGIPIIEDVVPTFCSVLVTGIMSCSLLYILDHNKYIKKAIEKLNSIPDIANFNVALNKQSELLDKYLAEFMRIDFDLLKHQEEEYSNAALQLSSCKSIEETNQCLNLIYKKLNIKLPWQGYSDFDSFMSDKKSSLTFA